MDRSLAVSTLPVACRGMEVSGFVRDPLQKALHVRLGAYRVEICIAPGELVIGEVCVDRTVADGVDGHRFSAAFTAGNTVVPLHPHTQGTTAKGADEAFVPFFCPSGALLRLLQRKLAFNPALHSAGWMRGWCAGRAVREVAREKAGAG
jgi:hypothetical protein